MNITCGDMEAYVFIIGYEIYTKSDTCTRQKPISLEWNCIEQVTIHC